MTTDSQCLLQFQRQRLTTEHTEHTEKNAEEIVWTEATFRESPSL